MHAIVLPDTDREHDFTPARGRYLFEVDGKRMVVSAGETVVAHVGSTHRFTNIADQMSRMLVLITPGFDAAAFFTELRGVMANGEPEPDKLRDLGKKWDIEFLGPPVDGVTARPRRKVGAA